MTKSYSEFDLLVKLYTINSKSGDESHILSFISSYLKSRGILYSTDRKGQIFTHHKDYDPDKPLLVAHTDQVQCTSPSKASDFLIEGNIISAPGFGLGADDKNGVWIILTLLSHSRSSGSSGVPFNFLFSTGEEIASFNAEEALKEMIRRGKGKTPSFALVLDRRGSGDIIGWKNKYCSKEFEKAVYEFSSEKGYGFKPVRGVFSDADCLSFYLNCVNLSVGYENAHTSDERTDLRALRHSRKFVWDLVSNAHRFQGFPKPIESTVAVEFTESELAVLAKILFEKERVLMTTVFDGKDSNVVEISSILDKVYDKLYKKM